MTFEQITKDYIVELKNQGVLIDANIIGVNEEFKTSTCIGFFLVEDIVKEQYIYIYDDKGTITWKFLIPIKNEGEIV